jgi:uncharacterized protein YbjT (DUF2867 family)
MASVVVFGATGLVGEALLAELSVANQVTSILSYGRRDPSHQCSKMRQVHGSFNALDVDLKDVQVDHCFIALGTTIRRAGSQQAFRDVDYRMVLDAATWAKGAGAKTVALVSSVGANPNAFAFYPRVKGEVEEALKALGVPRLLIFRPGLLLGDRSEFRFGEALATPLMRVLNLALVGSTARYRAIAADDVARAMVRMSLNDEAAVGKVVVAEGLDFYC